MKTKVYEFLYNSALHRTRKVAEMAMEFYKAKKRIEWEQEYPTDLKSLFIYNQWWGVKESELLP